MRRWKQKALAHFNLNKERSTLVSAIRVFLEDGSMMLLGILAAFLDHRNEWAKLGPCVSRVEDMGWALQNISNDRQREYFNSLPSHLS
jgi:hypothetical protein